MEDGDVKPEEMLACIRAKGRDNARTPMQWDDTPNAGFTTGTPWIRVNPNYPFIHAAAQENDPNSVLNYYRALIRLRRENPVIVYGDYRLALPEDPQIFAYERRRACWCCATFPAKPPAGWSCRPWAGRTPNC